MKGDPKVIEYLNAQLRNELTAINSISCMRGCIDTGAWKTSASTNMRSRLRR